MLKRKNIASLASLFILILMSLLFVSCDKTTEEKSSPTPTEEKRTCSFSIVNLDSEFPIDDVSFTVPYGINYGAASLENYKAGFVISKIDASRAVLQIVENLENDDYSFTVSEGNYSYKKETVLSLENSFFDKADGEFYISLCLFNKTDNLLEFPITGYQYKVAYRTTDSMIAFEIKNGVVIRSH